MQEDIEIWRSIPGYPKYEASNFGRIRSIRRTLIVNDPLYNRVYETTRDECIIKPYPNWRGYLRVDLRSTDRKFGRVEAVHRLVAMAFIPNPNNYPQVNHLSGIKTDNTVNNLEWCTNLHNRRHAQKLGLFGDMRGQNSPARKLDETQVRTIRRCLQDGMCYQDLATYFKVGKSAIKDIKHKRTWAYLL